MRLLVAGVAICLTACDRSTPTDPTPQTTHAAAVVVAGTAPIAGSTSQFTATLVAPDGTQTSVTTQAAWQSSNTAVFTVGADGVVRGIAPGTAQLSATYNSVIGTMPVVVSDVPCKFFVQPEQANIPGLGGSVTITVTMLQGSNCPWIAQASNSFLTFVGSDHGTGTGTLTVSALGNPGNPRTGTVTVAGAIVTISQVRGECVTSVSPTTAQIPEDAGSYLISVNAPAGCRWTVDTDANFITVSRMVMTGSGDVLYQVTPNTSTQARQAIFVIDRFQIVITQAGVSDRER